MFGHVGYIDLSFVTNEGYTDFKAKRCRTLAIPSLNIFLFFFGEAVRKNPDLHIVDQGKGQESPADIPGRDSG